MKRFRKLLLSASVVLALLIPLGMVASADPGDPGSCASCLTDSLLDGATTTVTRGHK
jgi:hypothetical protein